MLRLPPLVAGPHRYSLPVAGSSADALAEWLAVGDASAADDRLVDVLRRDPPLVLWAVCVADGRDHFQPRSVADVALWLARHGVDVLQWEANQGPASPPTAAPSPPEADADRVAAGVLLAELASRLAAEDGRPASESAFLLGLLDDAAGWLEPPGGAPPQDDSSCLPVWLQNVDDTPASAAVRLAREVAAGGIPLPDSAAIDLEACRSEASEARRRWLAPAAGIGARLPVLAEKLARLAALEHRFRETLEAEKLEAMAEFAAGAGHEINNPLTVIAGRAQLFLREETDPERRRALALINAQAKRAYEMIADMMLFARPPKPEPEPVDLVELVDQVIEDLLPPAVQEITLSRTGQDGPVRIEADATQLTVALKAMCQNAIEAIGGEGHVEIDVQTDGGDARIRISDDGPGIPPDERRHLFDPYYSARQAGRGLGLGLSKCWRIVTNHGGRIDVDSRPPHGSVFTIRLPQRQ